MIVSDRPVVLLQPTQYDIVLTHGIDAVATGNVFCGLDHGMTAQRITVEIAHHPILGFSRATWTPRIGVIKVRSIGDTITGQYQCGLSHS